MALLSSLLLVSPMFVTGLFLESLGLLSGRLPNFFMQISGTCMASVRITAFSRVTRGASWNWTILAMEGMTTLIGDSWCSIKSRSMQGKFEMFKIACPYYVPAVVIELIIWADHFTFFAFIAQHNSCRSTSSNLNLKIK